MGIKIQPVSGGPIQHGGARHGGTESVRTACHTGACTQGSVGICLPGLTQGLVFVGKPLGPVSSETMQ